MNGNNAQFSLRVENVSKACAKGFLYLADAPDQRTVLQMVGGRIRLEEGGGWGSAEPGTQVVFIGEAGLD